MNRSCVAWSNVNMHLLCFSVAQTLTVVGNLRLHTIGDLHKRDYYGWWVFQDIFHFITGIVLIICNLGAGALVTRYAKGLRTDLALACDQLQISRTQISVILTVLDSRIAGFRVWGHVLDVQKCVMFTFAMTVLIINTIFDILGNHMNYHSYTWDSHTV